MRNDEPMPSRRSFAACFCYLGLSVTHGVDHASNNKVVASDITHITTVYQSSTFLRYGDYTTAPVLVEAIENV